MSNFLRPFDFFDFDFFRAPLFKPHCIPTNKSNHELSIVSPVPDHFARRLQESIARGRKIHEIRCIARTYRSPRSRCRANAWSIIRPWSRAISFKRMRSRVISFIQESSQSRAIYFENILDQGQSLSRVISIECNLCREDTLLWEQFFFDALVSDPKVETQRLRVVWCNEDVRATVK